MSIIRMKKVRDEFPDFPIGKLNLIQAVGKNPIPSVINWCTKNGYSWLSMPELVTGAGIDGTMSLLHSFDYEYEGFNRFRANKPLIKVYTNSFVLLNYSSSDNESINGLNVNIAHSIPFNYKLLAKAYLPNTSFFSFSNQQKLKMTEVTKNFLIEEKDGLASLVLDTDMIQGKKTIFGDNHSKLNGLSSLTIPLSEKLEDDKIHVYNIHAQNDGIYASNFFIKNDEMSLFPVIKLDVSQKSSTPKHYYSNTSRMNVGGRQVEVVRR